MKTSLWLLGALLAGCAAAPTAHRSFAEEDAVDRAEGLKMIAKMKAREAAARAHPSVSVKR